MSSKFLKMMLLSMLLPLWAVLNSAPPWHISNPRECRDGHWEMKLSIDLNVLDCIAFQTLNLLLFRSSLKKLSGQDCCYLCKLDDLRLKLHRCWQTWEYWQLWEEQGQLTSSSNRAKTRIQNSTAERPVQSTEIMLLLVSIWIYWSNK
jgi:hypothetical protein